MASKPDQKLSMMQRIINSSRSVGKEAPAEPPPRPAAPATQDGGWARDPRLSHYVSARALKRPEGVGINEVLRALTDTLRSGDKEGRKQLAALLTRFFLFEELPADVIHQLVPLFQGQSKDVKVLRSLYYLAEVYIGKGSAGTPTLYDPTLVGKRPDESAMQGVLAEAWRLLQQPGVDPGLRRATFYLVAAAARGSEPVRQQLSEEIQRAISAADALASAASLGGGAGAGGGKAGRVTPRSAANDWDLQHTVFAANRLSGAATGADEISRSFMVGVGSPDPVGARHALALGAEVAKRDPSYVVRELYQAVEQAGQLYEAAGPAAPRSAEGQGINMEDGFARLHLARLCAQVVHSDQAAGDVTRDGAPFWNMLVLLAIRDPVDMVRFGAMEALTGSIASANAALTGVASSSGSGSKGAHSRDSREDVVLRQRRGRAWRLLAAQAGMGVTVPGAAPAADGSGAQQAATMRLIDVLGRLLVLALHKPESTARLTVAIGVVGSLAESCLASQSVGSTRHGSSPELDRVMTILATELGSLLEAPLLPSARCACIEALLYMQAAGFGSGELTPAKLLSAGGAAAADGGSATMQDALLSAVLRCARSKPKEAATFLGYASAVVGMAPAGLDLSKITDLWDAAAAAGKDGRAAVLAAVLDVLSSPPPPAAMPRPGMEAGEVARAAREEDGWNAFVATAVWWLGEHANSLCDEYCGRKLPSLGGAAPGVAGSNGTAAPAASADLLQLYAGRKPTLSRIIDALHSLALTGIWQLRLAAARALAKLAVRSGEPFRLRCYSLLLALGGSGNGKAGAGAEDPLGLKAATRPALALLDKVYSSQAMLEQLWQEHGDDVEGWPPEILASLQKRNRDLTFQAERSVCSLPKERYALLGQRAVVVLAQGQEEEGSFASFLKERVLEEEASGLSDRGGSELALSKNKEIDAILGSDDGASSAALRFAGGRSDASAGLVDRNREIESLLSGGSLGGGGADAWGFASTGQTSAWAGANAFADTAAATTPSWDASAAVPAAAGGSAASPTFATMLDSAGGKAETPRLGEYGSGAADSSNWFGQAEAAPEAAAAAPAAGEGLGTGTVLHTFVADYQQREEMSVFEGDQVEVLEESDGWMLVKDPSGHQGLVPTSYIRLANARPLPSDAGAAAAAAFPVSHHRRHESSGGGWGHRRSLSRDYQAYQAQQQSKEDYLDNLLSNYDHAATTIPEEAPASFGAPTDSSAFLGGGLQSYSSGSGVSYQQQQQPAARGPGSAGGSGTWGAEIAAPAATAGGAWGRQSDSGAASPVAGAAGGSAGSAAGGASPLLHRQSSNGNPFSPAAIHQRSASISSSHRRTLSGGSVDWSQPGSMPNTPSRVDGPERSVVAGFVGEMDGELTVDLGDRVKVHSEVGGWLRVIRLSDSRTGLVPSWAVSAD